MKSIKEYLPQKKNDEMIAFTARAPKKLLAQVKQITDKEGLSFTSVIESLLTYFVDEMSNTKKSA